MDVCVLNGKKGIWLLFQSCLPDWQNGAWVGHKGVTVLAIICALGPVLECFLLVPGYLFVWLYVVPRFKSMMVWCVIPRGDCLFWGSRWGLGRDVMVAGAVLRTGKLQIWTWFYSFSLTLLNEIGIGIMWRDVKGGIDSRVLCSLQEEKEC